MIVRTLRAFAAVAIVLTTSAGLLTPEIGYADASFGPPDRACGAEGEEPCEEGGEVVKAIDMGAAKNWGCQGKNLYFTPHGGGQCWSCPDGYRRTAKPIHKRVDACSKRGWGNDKKNSSFVRSVYGCPAGQFHRSGRCLGCPGSDDKVRGFLGINPKGQCTTRPGCDSGLALENGPAKVLTKFGAPDYTKRCTADSKPLNTIVSEGAGMLKNQTELTGLAIVFVKDVAASDTLKDAIKAKDGARVWRMIQSMRSFQRLKSKAEQDGFRSITLGSVADLQIGAGANQEAGVALDWTGSVKAYTTTGVSAGLAIGVDVSYSLGLWKSHLAALAGYAQGAAVAIPAGTPGIGPSVGAAAWFTYAPIQAAGFTVTAGVGVGAELGELNSTWTQVY